ncbi:MAG: hypothetical protein WCK34_07215 [Bacteroidota bacterium]
MTKVYRLAYPEISSVADYLLLGINFPYRPLNRISKDLAPKIVFVGDGIMPRISRMAKWIKRDGRYSTILIANKTGFVKEFSNDEWHGLFLFRNKYHLRRILKQIRGVFLYHAFAPKSFYPDVVRQMVKEPFLIDMQDVFANYYGLNPGIRWLKSEVPVERNCLLYADGIVAHSLEPNVALRKYGTGHKPPTVFFPLYCDNDKFLQSNRTLDPDDIHVVYAGGVAGSHRDRSHYGSIMFHDLIRVLDEQHIHFHIYPSPSNIRADYEEYEQIARSTTHFHLHAAVSQEAMAGELSKYHFGLLPFFSTHTGQSKEKYKYATSLKLFNYIEAGLPIMVSEDLTYQSWIVKRYEAGIVIGKEDLTGIRKLVMLHDYPAMVANLIRRREEISLRVHVPRLLRFYQETAARKDSKS